MNFKIGIVGLPNVGKSTLFNALTKSSKAAAANFPFCTIDPNVGIVEVPDHRIDELAKIVNPERIVRSVIEFVDIAGLVAGASQGEGLGNKFLSHIRECSAICHVLRDFEDSNVHHVAGVVNPKNDFEVVVTELILADLESVTRQVDRVTKKARSGDKESKIELSLLERVKEVLEKGILANTLEPELTEEEQKIFRTFQLLTAKKFIIVANTSEKNFAKFDEVAFRQKLTQGSTVVTAGIPIVPISAQIESELVGLSDEEAKEFLREIGAERSGLESLAKAGFELLGLQSYFTAGVKEVRAWTIYKGDTAPRAAAAIHTDFEKGFIKAEVIAYSDYVQHKGEAGSKEAGRLRMEGKEYIVQDGDVMHFRFNV